MDDEPNRLHPEGAPGALEGMLRQFMGDTGYERLRDADASARDEALAAARATTALTRALAGLVSVVTVAILVVVLLGVGWSIWAWVG